jgi:hypothetical protein
MDAATRDRSGLASRLRIGIAGRLLLAFSAVAALVLSANFIALEGMSTSRTTTITRYKARPQQTPIAPVPVIEKAPAPVAPVVAPQQNVAAAAEALTRGLAVMTQAVQFRVEKHSPASDEEWRRSISELDHSVTAFRAEADTPAEQPVLKRLATDIRALEQQAATSFSLPMAVDPSGTNTSSTLKISALACASP